MLQSIVEASRSWRGHFVRIIIKFWEAIKPKILFYEINKQLVLTDIIQQLFSHLNLPARPTDYIYQKRQYIHNCAQVIELSQNCHETEPWRN